MSTVSFEHTVGTKTDTHLSWHISSLSIFTLLIPVDWLRKKNCSCSITGNLRNHSGDSEPNHIGEVTQRATRKAAQSYHDQSQGRMAGKHKKLYSNINVGDAATVKQGKQLGQTGVVRRPNTAHSTRQPRFEPITGCEPIRTVPLFPVPVLHYTLVKRGPLSVQYSRIFLPELRSSCRLIHRESLFLRLFFQDPRSSP